MVNAATEDDAVEAGRSIARNNLLKCAIHGEDPNWGRVLSAIGTTGAAFEPDRLNVATLWANDLTAEYVHENSAYSS